MRLNPTKVISVTSGKGGVGKTHTSINLALQLTKLGKKVLILDADLGLANVNVLLGFKPTKHIGEILAAKASIKEVIVHHESGIDILPASSGVAELTKLTEEEQTNLISAFDSLTSSYDYLIVDTAAGIGDNVLYFNTAAEEILVIIDREPTSITDAYAVIKVLSQRAGVKTFNVLVNRCPVGNDGKSIFAQLANVTGKFLNVSLKFIGSVQEDSAVREATIQQQPYSELYPSSRASMDIAQIAKRIDDNKAERSARGGMQFFFKSLVENVG
jgi:flagellar biosynthesis protein FlhG